MDAEQETNERREAGAGSSEVPRSARSAKVYLLDLHFEVRNAIAEMSGTPDAGAKVALHGAIHRFLAAAQMLASKGEAVAGQVNLEERRAELLRGLQVLDAATDRSGYFRATESLRRTFLEMCHPLWTWKDRVGPRNGRTTPGGSRPAG